MESLMPHDELRQSDLPNIRAERFALITGQASCWKCHAPIKVSALVLDVHEEMDPEYGDWSVSHGRIMLQFITSLNADVFEQVKLVAPWLRPGFSRMAEATYLANHCPRCSAIQGERFLTQPGAVFFPCGTEVKPFETDVFNLNLEAEAGFSESAWLDDLSI
jgi:hypothetical protein